MAEAKQLETWKNVSGGHHWIKQQDRLGDIIDVHVAPDKVLNISPDERRLNQDLVAVASFDPFTNGSFTPVKLIETEEDAAEIASNPNLLTESAMREFFGKGSNWRAFDAKVEEISNQRTLQRLLEIAKEENATIRQVEKIEARLVATSPTADFMVEVDQLNGQETTAIRPVTPK